MLKKIIVNLLSLSFIFNLSSKLMYHVKDNNANTLETIAINRMENTRELNWFFKPNNLGLPPEAPEDSRSWIKNYNAYYLGDTSKKVLYLTFDEGYEMGYTEKILDVLKKHNVKASFFVVKPYIKTNAEIVKRMDTEGHLVCNHSANHPSMASIKSFELFKKELTEVEDSYRELTGKEMPKYFRPPMGKYSELSLKYTKDLGYKSIFWSFAYNDWNTKKQPSREASLEIVKKRTHNGGIILLHAVSKTNADILDELIKYWLDQGFEMRLLTDL